MVPVTIVVCSCVGVHNYLPGSSHRAPEQRNSHTPLEGAGGKRRMKKGGGRREEEDEERRGQEGRGG